MFHSIFKRLEGYSPTFDRDQLIAVVATMIFAMVDLIVNLILIVLYVGIPEVFIMNIFSILLVLFAMYLIIVKYRYVLGCYVLILMQCYYLIYTTYFLGYEKDAILIAPVIMFAIHFILRLKKKHIKILTNIVAVSFGIIVLINLLTVPKYGEELKYFQYVNALLAISFCFFVIKARTIAEKFVNRYGKDENSATSKEAYQDFLTGLWNRRYMEREFSKIDGLKNGVIVLADIDFFKKVNDNYGHNTGDYVLKKVSDIYRYSLRDCDVVCRWGGEEFLFYIKNVSEETAISIVENLRLKIEKTTFKFEEYEFNITVSFGLTSIDSTVPILENIDRADKAMYYCKHNGRNMVASFKDCNLGVEDSEDTLLNNAESVEEIEK